MDMLVPLSGLNPVLCLFNLETCHLGSQLLLLLLQTVYSFQPVIWKVLFIHLGALY